MLSGIWCFPVFVWTVLGLAPSTNTSTGSMVHGNDSIQYIYCNVSYTCLLYLTTLLTSPIKFSLYFQNYVRYLDKKFREVRKIYETGVKSKFMRVNLFIAPAYSKVRYRGSTFRPFVRSSVRPSVHNLCQGAYSVAVIAGSMKPCIVITLNTLHEGTLAQCP